MQFLGKGGSNARLQRAIEWTAKYPKFFITYFGPTRVSCTLNHPDTVKILLKGAGKRFHLNMGTGFGIITNIVRVIFHTALQYSLCILQSLRTILTRRILYIHVPSRLYMKTHKFCLITFCRPKARWIWRSLSARPSLAGGGAPDRRG